VARTGQRKSGGGNSGRGSQRRQSSRPVKRELIAVLTETAQKLDRVIQRPPTTSTLRAKFQAVALVAREERSRVIADDSLGDTLRTKKLRQLDGVATLLARTAVRDTSLLQLLADDARVTDSARNYKLELMRAGGLDVTDEPEPVAPVVVAAPAVGARDQVEPQSVTSRKLANPFLAPDFSAAAARSAPQARRLAGWELLEPLFNSFERGSTGDASCMTLPAPRSVPTPPGRELMPHQAQVVTAAADGHRTFLLADEPGLGKTAQALLAAQAANAYPLLVVTPNVVKANWENEVRLWTPQRQATVVHGDGDRVDGFADIVIVNYELLDRHLGWLGDFGFRGMIVDEAHFIKNKSSQRSQHILALSERIHTRAPRPLLMALTGTPLINDIEDFRAIWQFLGWIDDTTPLAPLMASLEDKGLTPVDPGFYAAARQSVIEMGIVRRQKVDVVADMPARRVADLPVELEGPEGRSILAAEAALAERLVGRYRAAAEARRNAGEEMDGIDAELIRRIATSELKESDAKNGADNVFTMVRRIGQAKAGLAADFAAQLARNVGKVVFFAKHIDVMDQAEKTFADRGIRYASIRGDQTPKVREKNIDAFVNDPDVAIVVCSLTAAGVGLNLLVASNLVLAELSWTDAEQTQAIDRIHRIGQEQPVTAWRIVAAHTIDSKIAALIDSKSGLAARALDGAPEEDEGTTSSVQLEALVGMLTEALEADGVG
jgi:hypothetical protein